ncbi:S24 family peptidase [Cereibacter changlensis]|uniref:S24 family peptidase n=1 Tax=Cereibacter changlensis TaxID=402884 RepID=UPI00403461C9
MEKYADQFGEIVAQRLKALNTSAFAVETGAGLPPDAVRNVIRSEKRSGPTLSRVQEICEALGLELYIGPKREAGVVESVVLDGADFSQIPLHEAYLAAGDGHLNGDAPIVGQLAFRKDWLNKIGVSPSKAVLARVHGDSMQPTMQPDDLVMIDRARNTVPVRARAANDRRPATIYALLHEGQARIKRIERPEEGLMMLISDNPAYGPEILTGSRIEALNIIGKVMWWGHTNRE